MKLKESYSIIIILILLMSGCTPYDFIPKSAGDNKDNLIAVLNYCRKDSNQCKYASAEFLVKNMGWHISEENDGVYSDAAILSYDFLREHIDHAVEQWQSSPYSKDLTFEEFCEYLLPYRAAYGFGHNVSGKERYDWVIEHIGLPDSITDIKELIKHYNNGVHALRERGGKRNIHYRDGLNDLLYDDYTDCADKAVQTCLNLRAIGVPCVVEHNLGYRTFKAHHYHCAVWDTQHKEWIKFNGEEVKDYPGEGDWTSAELLNLYRETYAPQAGTPYVEGAKMPRGFVSPCQKDVTHHTVSIEIPLDTIFKEQVPYLATFHRSETGLQPFTYGRIVGDKAIFDHVVPTVWYVVAIYPQGKQQIISRPFWVNDASNGMASMTYADFSGVEGQTEDITIYRKYPIKERLVKRARTLIGTTIEGANHPDFWDAHLLWRLDSMPLPKVAYYPFLKTGDYKYYRLNTPEACEVSVLEWLTADGVLPISDKNNKAYDRNMTTAPTDSTSITLSLTDPQCVVGINLAPINADNAITPGHEYQLYMWSDNEGWKFHSKQRASSEGVAFRNVQKESLLWLKDISKGQEEMPFKVTNNTQSYIY